MALGHLSLDSEGEEVVKGGPRGADEGNDSQSPAALRGNDEYVEDGHRSSPDERFEEGLSGPVAHGSLACPRQRSVKLPFAPPLRGGLLSLRCRTSAFPLAQKGEVFQGRS